MDVGESDEDTDGEIEKIFERLSEFKDEPLKSDVQKYSTTVKETVKGKKSSLIKERKGVVSKETNF